MDDNTSEFDAPDVGATTTSEDGWASGRSERAATVAIATRAAWAGIAAVAGALPPRR